MHDVIVRNVMEEETAHPPEEVTIDGGGGTTLVVPLALAVVREHRVGVVKVGDHDEPVVR